ncbi:carboxylate-amine ligase [Streptantibioticus cattleyicolor NRRL 8057 = DSM 46488]|uniref:Putative glutamate--cysteine ligase 2 n=1 Tax=Streptantibioticus cattleyicolor (strain ATCC 35852 / DSM 46488 / JCM 4925 / NBRC 14057 / NRRL 8057) TaxID=1003195 RepID=G8WMN4_STREN|nr:carboxylate-amine ligase [Streptantibioticus cattleyicolor NRRL 8057 = DSM 46488]
MEEELLLVDPGSGKVTAVAGQVLARSGSRTGPRPPSLAPEIQREQVEVATCPCTTLEELAGQIRQGRATASEQARRAGAEVAALATAPLPADPSLTGEPRYRRMAEEFGLTAQQQLTCGCHIHVEVTDPEEGVAVLDRIRPWLPPLVALSANSPYWQGCDSHYDSFRYQAWGRWPTAGPTELFGSAAAYREVVAAMLATGTILDEGMVYFDARLSRRYPTVEVRVADVCLEAADTVLLAALVRGLVETASRAWRAGQPADPVPVPVLRLAGWRASRSGITGTLLHPRTHVPAPAGAVLDDVVCHLAPVLADQGELAAVDTALARLRARGNGARAQRARHSVSGSLADTVRYAVERTLS